MSRLLATLATRKHLAVLFSELGYFCSNLFADGLSNGFSIYKVCLLNILITVCLYRLGCTRCRDSARQHARMHNADHVLFQVK